MGVVLFCIFKNKRDVGQDQKICSVSTAVNLSRLSEHASARGLEEEDEEEEEEEEKKKKKKEEEEESPQT